MRHRKTPIGVREHIGSHPWVRLPDLPPGTVALEGPEPIDLPTRRVAPAGAR